MIVIPDKDVETALNDPGVSELYSTNDLKPSDKIIASVGTFCDRYSNNDWKWIKLYVKKLIPARRFVPAHETEKDYKIIKLSPFKWSWLRHILPAFCTIDVSGEKGLSYGRILRYQE